MLKDIVSISGQGGLFKFVSQAKNCIIVESLSDKKRFPVYTTTKVSSLEDIAIFTEDEEVPLEDVLKKISNKENKGKAINPKSSGDELKKYFKEVLPNFDQDRVYVSDIKKLLTWYNILQELDLLKFETKKPTSPAGDEEGKEEAKEKTAEKKSACKKIN